jgi:ATP-dependent Clp protease ATP-binding subunit ClpX
MKDSDCKIPDQKDLEKELNDYLGKKYGDRIRLVVPMLFPKAESEEPGKIEKEAGGGKSRVQFDLKPEELESFLNDYIIKQQDAKEILATKICTHFNSIQYSESRKGRSRYEGVGQIKNNILMIGPTGVGKTYLIKLIAKRIGVPFVKGDATKFSETGYVGGDVEDLVRDLVYEANGDIELAQYGIIYIDEIDKIASAGNLVGPDVSRTGVQRALLKLMEETEVDLKVAHDPISQLEAIEQFRKSGKREKRAVNTRNILFIMSGAFSGLEEIVKKRLNREGIGFGAEVRSKDQRVDYFKQVKSEDLVAYGFETEFIGRLPVTAVFERLEVEDLYTILRSPKNPIVLGKKKDFKSYGIDVQFEDEALHQLAVNAYEEKTGARGLVSAAERALLKFEKRLPSTDVRRFVVTRAVVDRPDEELKGLLHDPSSPEMLRKFEGLLAEEKASLKESILRREEELKTRHGVVFPESRIDLVVNRMVETGEDVDTVFEEAVHIHRLVEEFRKEFQRRNGVGVCFTQDGLDRITEIGLEEDEKGCGICARLTKDYEHGFRLIRDRVGQREFLLSKEAVDEPEKFLNRIIRDVFAKESDGLPEGNE